MKTEDTFKNKISSLHSVQFLVAVFDLFQTFFKLSDVKTTIT